MIVLIAASLWTQHRKVEAQEMRIQADLQQQEADLVRSLEEAGRELNVEMAQSRIEMEIADLLSDDATSKAMSALQEKAGLTLKELFERMHQENPTDESLNGLREELLDELAATAQAELLEALVTQIRTFIHSELVPSAVREMEKSLQHQGGSQLLKEVRRFMDENRIKEADQTVLREALPLVHPALAKELSEDIQSELVPQATVKVLDAFEKEISQLPVDAAELRKLISQDIAKAMAEEMAKSDPQEEIVTLRSRTEMGLESTERTEQAKREITDMINTVRDLDRRQQELMDKSAPGEETARQQAEITAAAQKLHRQAFETGHMAELTAVTHQAYKAGGIAHTAQWNNPADQGRRATTAAREGTPGELRSAQENVRKTLERWVEPLQAAADLMDAEKSALSDKIAARQQVAVTPEISAQARQLAEALTDDLDAISRKSVEVAAQNLKPQEVLGESLNEELQAALEMNQKIASARQRLKEGRELSRDPLQSEVAAIKVGQGGIPPPQIASHHYNREAYEAFVKDLKNRTNPGNAYGAVGAVENLATRASGDISETPAQVYVRPSPTKAAEPKDEKPRELAKPDFKSIDFAGAPMQTTPLRIDGDLSDWGDLEHPLTMKWYADDEFNRFEGGSRLYMRWAPEGLYFAYRVEGGGTPRVPHSSSPYSGDVLEIWLDLKNSRDTSMQESQFAHQFILSGFGFGNIGGTFLEYGRGARGLTPGRSYFDETEKKGLARAKSDSSGYTVEGFVAASTLAKPVLVPGSYLAANFSINRGSFGGRLASQWSASKSVNTHLKPDTWGDVLLLGTDATVKVMDLDGADLPHVVVGQPLQVEVTDADMNIRSDLKDRVAASLVTGMGGAPLLIVLEETGVNTGVFRASADTQAFFKSAKPNTINLRQGDTVTFEYQDPRGAYGEANRKVSISIPVAWAVFADN